MATYSMNVMSNNTNYNRQQHFYIHLPSNSSASVYPNNTKAEFTTRLANHIDLWGEWEVGLTEMYFSKCLLNVVNDETIAILFSNIKSTGPNTPSHYVHYIKVEKGHYSNGYELVNHIRSKIAQLHEKYTAPHMQHETMIVKEKRMDHWPNIKYKRNKNVVEITVPYGVTISFNTLTLGKILGFDESALSIKGDSRNEQPTVYESNHPLDFNGPDDLQAFYIYANILDRVKVGDTEAPLLRIVDGMGEEKLGSLVKRHYDFPFYVPLQKKNFQEIEIKILTDQGEPIPFTTGKVILTLHFRKVGN